jgi:hypothetical protein
VACKPFDDLNMALGSKNDDHCFKVSQRGLCSSKRTLCEVGEGMKKVPQDCVYYLPSLSDVGIITEIIPVVS